MRVKEENKYLRIFVDAGGCSGFQYNFEMVEKIDEEQDYLFEKDDIQLLMDSITLSMLNNCTVDYTIEMIRSSFEIHANPNAELGCSCGTSFSPKNM